MSEELKALVEVARTVSGDARSVLVYWLGYQVFSDLLMTGFLIWLIHAVLALARRVVLMGHVSKKVARHLGLDEDADRIYRDNEEIHAWVDRKIADESAGRSGPRKVAES